MAISKVSLIRQFCFNSTILPQIKIQPLSVLSNSRRFIVSALKTSKEEEMVDGGNFRRRNNNNGWKPMCLYFTQDKCTMMQDSSHLQKFNHSFALEHALNATEYKNRHSEHLDFFLVLDLEGKVEILEFPVLMIDARTMDVVAFFHRFVRPTEMSEDRINQYIEGKYGKFGVDRVWHDTAIPFDEVIIQFEEWMAKHSLPEILCSGS
uniref:Uncharacterized exonuclease domain-containing protein At3g15140 n=1 Tax=Tanacetum cinerariifolium TaxID=118510 RepID=A0A699GUV1_TANCI|nr:uncharacterized exonuclease domain-containing protein At3g15140 [Tanacetum cinerariifolium]